MATEKERQEEGEAPPHPRLEPFHREVQVVPLPQGSQSVETTSLVIVLQELNTALKNGER